MTIYNFQNGARGIRVAWLCEEMGVSYHPVVLPFPTPPSYRARHPLGSVPFLEDGNEVAIGESIAIMLHLAERYGPSPLLPQGPAKAKVLELAIMSEATLGGTLNTLLASRYAGPASERQSWSVRHAEDQVSRQLQYLADRLGDASYLVGDSITMADIAVATAIGIWRGGLAGVVPAKLERWRDQLSGRPAYRRAAASFSGPLQT